MRKMTNYFAKDRSHPTWVRGLKLMPTSHVKGSVESHPTWVRGLKRAVWESTKYFGSRTLRGCVD